jgi:hypothetical protein
MADKVIAFGELGTEPFASATSGVGKPANVPPPVLAVSSPVLDPLRYPEAWTYVQAAGVRSPGVVPADGGVEGWDREDKWDVKAGKGTTGATTTRVAMEPAKGSFTFHLWTVEQHEAWANWLSIFKYDASKKTGQATAIYHPALASVQPPITSVVMTKHSPIRADSRGLSVVKIELLEYFPSKPSGASTATGAKQYTTGKGNDTGTQVDPVIAKLQAQAKALAAQAAGTA